MVTPDTPEEASARTKKQWLRRAVCNKVGLILGVCVVAPFGILLADRGEPIELLGAQIIPEVVRPGQTVTVVWTAKEHRACDGMFARRVVDASGKIHEFQREPTVYHHSLSQGPRDTRQTFTTTFTMPDGMVDGEAYYQTKGVRWCNFLQHHLLPITFESPKVKFYVQTPKVQERVIQLITPSPFAAASAPPNEEEAVPLPKPKPKAKRQRRRR